MQIPFNISLSSSTSSYSGSGSRAAYISCITGTCKLSLHLSRRQQMGALSTNDRDPSLFQHSPYQKKALILATAVLQATCPAYPMNSPKGTRCTVSLHPSNSLRAKRVKQVPLTHIPCPGHRRWLRNNPSPIHESPTPSRTDREKRSVRIYTPKQIDEVFPFRGITCGNLQEISFLQGNHPGDDNIFVWRCCVA